MSQSIVLAPAITPAASLSVAPDLVAPDLVALLLADKRSLATKRAYAGDLEDFLSYFQSSEIWEIQEICAPHGGLTSPQQARLFCALPVAQIALLLAGYKAHLRGRALAEATINRRLAAIKSLLKFAHRMGLSATDGRNLVDGERVIAYRDTRGVGLAMLKKILAAPSRLFGASLRARRDFALLLLLSENALRRAEVCALDAADFDGENRALWVRRKGKGSQKVRVTLSPKGAGAIAEYLGALPDCRNFAGQIAGLPEAPLFSNLIRDAEKRDRLTPGGLHHLVGEYGKAVGLKRLTPHQFRHSAITLALDAGMDIRKVQKLSGHANLKTLQIYDDARQDFGGEVTNALSDLLHK